MNIQGLIERYEKFKASKKKMTSVDLVLKDLRSLDEPEPLPFKLKDVVGRIRGFDPMTQARWLNDILKELGDDYGSMKYREGYEQGKFEGAWVGNQLKDADKIRRELNKVKVPQFVADWISFVKTNGIKFKNTYGFYEEITPSDDVYRVMYYIFKESIADKGIRKWVADNIDTFARAWLDGYEVEKEKQYLMKMPNANFNDSIQILSFKKNSFFWSSNWEGYKVHHTRKQLEEAGFGWVFDCEGVEVQEVEG